MTVIEVAWTLLALVGIWLAYLNGIESYRDLESLGGRQNGRRTIAVGNFRREVVRGLIQIAWLLIGLVALVTPNRTDAVSPLALLLVLTSAGMTLNSWMDRRDRVYLMRYGLQPRDEAGRFTSE